MQHSILIRLLFTISLALGALRASTAPAVVIFNPALLKQAALPPAADILRHGVTQSLSIPPAQAWQAILHIATQCPAILAINAANPAERRLIVLDGMLFDTIRPAGLHTLPQRFPSYQQAWLAIAVKSDSSDGPTTIAISPIDPASGKTLDTHPSASDPLSADFTKIIANFFYRISVQSRETSDWLAKFQSPLPALRGVAPGIKMETNPGFDQLAIAHGNWCSYLVRSYTPTIACPPGLSRQLDQMTAALLTAAGQPGRRINVFIIASGEINAFALPNGDIFICSGLLNCLDTQEQLAAVLAHEIDHVLQRDGIRKLTQSHDSKIASDGIMTVGSIFVGLALSYVSSSAAAHAAGPNIDTSGISQDITQGTMLLNMKAGATAAMLTHNLSVLGYSRDTELRADCNAVRYLWGAGYGRTAYIDLLTLLAPYQPSEGPSTVDSKSCLLGPELPINTRKTAISDVSRDLHY